MADDLKKADKVLADPKSIESEKEQANAFKAYAKALTEVLHAIDLLPIQLFQSSVIFIVIVQIGGSIFNCLDPWVNECNGDVYAS